MKRLKAWTREARMRARSWEDRGELCPPKVVAALVGGGILAILVVLAVPIPETLAQTSAGIGEVVSGITSDGFTAAVEVGAHDGRYPVALSVWGTWASATARVQMKVCSACAWADAPEIAAAFSKDSVSVPVAAYRGTQFRLEIAGSTGTTSLSYLVVQ